jgi:hypothetical protein
MKYLWKTDTFQHTAKISLLNAGSTYIPSKPVILPHVTSICIVYLASLAKKCKCLTWNFVWWNPVTSIQAMYIFCQYVLVSVYTKMQLVHVDQNCWVQCCLWCICASKKCTEQSSQEYAPKFSNYVLIVSSVCSKLLMSHINCIICITCFCILHRTDENE